MKKQFLKSLALAVMLLCGLTASASSGLWCEKSIGHEKAGGAAGADVNSYVLLTVKNNGDGTITFTVANDPDKNTKDVDYILINPGYGSAGKDVASNALMSQSVTYTLPAGTTELKGVEILWSNSGWDGRWMVKNLNIAVSDMCTDESVEKETIKPVMGAASLAEVSHNAAVINVVGTDQETKDGEDVAVTRFKVVYGETTNTYTASNGQITITGLTAGTTYSFEIYAVDAVGNVSEKSASVKATTESRESQCSGERGHFGNPNVKRIAYTIAYNPTKKAVVYTISALGGKKLDVMEVHTTKGNYGVTIPTNAATTCTYTQTGVTEGEEMGIRFLYSTEDMGGNEMTAEAVDMSDPNIIYYKVGECPMEEDAVAPVMVKAELVSNTYNSAVIAVEATDNNGVASYNVVDATNAFDANFAAVDGKITVTGLTPGKTYNLAISAVDLAGNVSEGAKSVQVVTPMHYPAPTTAAPVPAHEADYVKAIYSATYEADCQFGEWESGTTYVQDTHGKKFVTNEKGYFGLYGFSLNCAAMETFHADVWVADNCSMRFVPITGQAEQGVTKNLVGGQWNSIEIALNEGAWANTTNWTNVYQLKIDNASNLTFWMNNIYFYTTLSVDAEKPKMGNATITQESVSFTSAVLTVTGATDNVGIIRYLVKNGETEVGKFVPVDNKITVTGLPAGTSLMLSVYAMDAADNVSDDYKAVSVTTTDYPAPAAAPNFTNKSVLAIYADGIDLAVAHDFNLNTWGGAKYDLVEKNGQKYILYNAEINWTAWGADNADAEAIVGKEGCKGTKGGVNASTMNYLHVDIYTDASCPSFKLLVNDTELGAQALEGEGWHSLDFPLSAYPATPINDWGLDNVNWLKFLGWNGVKYVGLDNVYFWKNSGGATSLDAAEVAPKVTKRIENGQVVIIREGVKYNVVGAVIEK